MALKHPGEDRKAFNFNSLYSWAGQSRVDGVEGILIQMLGCDIILWGGVWKIRREKWLNNIRCSLKGKKNWYEIKLIHIDIFSDKLHYS